jgi:hypothetical protein
VSFPEPILNHEEVSKYSVQPNFPEGLSGPAQDQHIDEWNLQAVASVHGRPQGEILQALYNNLPLFNYLPSDFRQTLTRYVNLVNWAS